MNTDIYRWPRMGVFSMKTAGCGRFTDVVLSWGDVCRIAVVGAGAQGEREIEPLKREFQEELRRITEELQQKIDAPGNRRLWSVARAEVDDRS